MKILFFAQLREVTGLDQAEIDADGLDASSLWNLLVTVWPELAVYRSQVRLARNGRYAGSAEIFVSGDEVALIPPVSGG
ncbi:MAG: MoaD/ThiS family protein [Chthoniobacterales bacterium]